MASTHETRFLLTAKNNTKGVFSSVRGDLKSMATGAAQLAGTIAGLAGAVGFTVLGNGLVDTNIQFQTLLSSLKTIEGSSAGAQKTFDKIVEFATTTPFALEEVAGAFVKLKALGLDPSEEAITSYGNTAAAMGKSLNQMIEAVADASTGEFERLKEFGITAKTQGDQVTFTFQGVATTVGKNAADITGYLESIGKVQFAGAMSDQMKNVGPAFDNFGTAIDLLQVKIGEGGLNDAIANTTNTLTDFIKSMDQTVISEATQSSLQVLADTLNAISSTTDAIGKGFEFLSRGVGYDPVGELGASAQTLPNYKLGDFGKANNTQAIQRENFKKDIEAGVLYKASADELKEQTPLLRRVADGIEKAAEPRAG